MICVKRNECINVFFQKKQTCFLVNCLTLYKFNFEHQKQENYEISGWHTDIRENS